MAEIKYKDPHAHFWEVEIKAKWGYTKALAEDPNMDVVTFYFTPLAAELEDLNGKALDIGLDAPQMIANYTTKMLLKENDEGVKRGEPDKSVWDTDPYYTEEDLDKFSDVEIETYGQGFRAGYGSGLLSMMACESYEAAVERTAKQGKLDYHT